MNPRPFIKMHGLGNDFVVVDARMEPFVLDDDAARAVADRRAGVGCDQLIVMEPPTNGAADVFMRIRNADGGEVEACGNATRCVAALIMEETGRERCTVETQAGLLHAVCRTVDQETAWINRPNHDCRWINFCPTNAIYGQRTRRITRNRLRSPQRTIPILGLLATEIVSGQSHRRTCLRNGNREAGERWAGYARRCSKIDITGEVEIVCA